MKQMSRKAIHVAACSAAALFIALLVVTGSLTDRRIEQHRLAQVQLERLSRMVPHLRSLEHHLTEDGEVEPLLVQSVDGLLRAAYEALAHWEQSRPLGDRAVVGRVSEAGYQYLNTYRHLLFLYRDAKFEEGHNWQAGQMAPALSRLQSELGVVRTELEAEAERAQWQRMAVDISGGVVGMLLFILLVWRLEKSMRRTEHLEQEQALRESRARHIQAILSNMVDGILIVGADGLILHLSAGVERMFGYTAAEALGQPIRSIVHATDLHRNRFEFDAMAATPGAEFRGEMRVRHADGTYRNAEVVLTNLLHETDIQGILVQAHDITARKEAEEALRESETRLRATFRQLPAALFLVDRDLQVIEAAGTSLHGLGFSPEAVCGRSLTEFLALMDRGDEVVALYQQVLAGQPLQWEAELLGRSFRASAEPFRNRDGEVVGVLTICLDITESTRAQAELEEQERLHRLITENSIELDSLYAPDGTPTYCSQASRSMLGYSPEEYMAASVEELVHPDDVDAVLAFRQASFTGQAGAHTYRMKRRDGQYVWFETITRPIQGENGQLVGVIASSRDITERKRFEEQLSYLAYHDEQTRLPNRAAFMERLTERLDRADGVRVGVVYLEIDNLRAINESWGLEAGDLVLKQSACRLREQLPPQYFVARCGGDEFAIFLELPIGAELPQDLSKLLVSLFDAPTVIGFREVQVTCSLGISLGRAGESTAGELVRQANNALHHAKSQGTQCALFHPSMSAGAEDRLVLGGDLRRAIREGELQLYYQPIVDLERRSFAGAEALVRWKHPVRGWVPPSQFIPLAEQTGYIDRVGRWVLEEACLEARRMLDSGVSQEHFSMSVNLSPIQFRRTGFVEEIAEVLAETGLPARYLTLELTESTLMENPTAARAMLQRLKGLGIQIAVDDFGTGHSSLSYLKQFPVDILKLDRSFVSGLGENLVDRELARMVVSLARALGLRVTAEGVESEAQLAELREIGCHRAQGYFFARPAPPDEIMMLLIGPNVPGVH